jgi:hypothetical protein
MQRCGILTAVADIAEEKAARLVEKFKQWQSTSSI